ncbi:MAG: T9SS type A sorting domain-containing protein [Bacteroidia bacterium]
MMKSLLFIVGFLFWQIQVDAQCKKIYSFDTDQYGGPSITIEFNGKLVFSAFDPASGRELWCTDGTESGTFMIKDIWAGTSSGVGDYFNLTSFVHNNILYFRGDNGVHGVELWRSDGTTVGTYMISDLASGPNSSAPGEFAGVDSIVYFTANTGSQLWRTNGTAQGTYSLMSFNVIRDLYGFNGKLYFSADQNNTGEELWRSNGTVNGTFLLKDLNGVVGASLPCNFYNTNNTLFFTAVTNDGWELWKTDGTNAGTVMVKDVFPGGNNGVMDTYSEKYFSHIGDTLYFAAKDNNSGYQLWRSDGTGAGTVSVSNVPNGILLTSPFSIVDGNVAFYSFYSDRFWMYSPSLDSSYITNYPAFYALNLYPQKYLYFGSNLFYATKDTLYGAEVWVSDGVNSSRRLQETHLVDNWYPGISLGFNSIIGTVGSKLVLSQARNPYDVRIPFFVYDTLAANTCFPPSVIVGVPATSTSMHLVWNRVEETTTYQIRYKKSTDLTWTLDSTQKSYYYLNNLDSTSIYNFQLTTNCSGVTSTWSDTILYQPTFLGNNNNYLNLLAEREEDSTTVRLYWLKTNLITKVQFRYRPYGSTTWSYSTSNDGYKRLTSLTPNTFYEYTYREEINGTWNSWYSGSFYFNTSGSTTTSINEPSTNLGISIFPNPTSDLLHIKFSDQKNYQLKLVDVAGRILKVYDNLNTETQISTSSLRSGIYLLQFTNDNGIVYTQKVLVK